ncbi:MAG TPA: hypothetical protein PLD59_07585 [Tepidisphaeraceae bacterium]|nr:hypothetical protein [Tepidisphaeraceae bacterium]
MGKSHRVKIDSNYLFQGFVSTKESRAKLADDTGMSIRTVENILNYNGAPNRGFYSDGITQICRALNKDPEKAILGRLPRRKPNPGERRELNDDASAAVAGFNARATLPQPRPIPCTVRADASPHDACEPAELIHLAPGEAIEFLLADPGHTWTHDRTAAMDDILGRISFVHPASIEREFLSKTEIERACDALDTYFVKSVRHWLERFGMAGLRKIAQTSIPAAAMTERAGPILQSAGLRVPPDWALLQKYVADLKAKITRTRKPIAINLKSEVHAVAGKEFWRWSLERSKANLNGSAKGSATADIEHRYGPAGASTEPAGEGYPLPAAPVGSCILFAGTLTSEGRLNVIKTVAFASPGDRFTNTTAGPLSCRLGCNDPYPGDNAGELKLGVAIHAPPAEPTS